MWSNEQVEQTTKAVWDPNLTEELESVYHSLFNPANKLETRKDTFRKQEQQNCQG